MSPNHDCAGEENGRHSNSGCPSWRMLKQEERGCHPGKPGSLPAGGGLREGRIQSGREWLGDTRLDTPVEECARGQWAWPVGGRAAQGGMALAGR